MSASATMRSPSTSNSSTRNALVVVSISCLCATVLMSAIVSFDDQCRIGAPEAEGIGQQDTDLPSHWCHHDVQTLREFVRFLEIQVGSQEAAMHHQHGVDHLAGARHPAFMAGEALGGTHRWAG